MKRHRSLPTAVVLVLVLVLVLGLCLASCGGGSSGAPAPPATSGPPNIVLILADDLGYGDVSSYGATRIATPQIDQLAAEGIRFTNVHATAATCTPSRYSILTGQYAWRRPDTGIAAGDASLLIPPGSPTLPAILKRAGYATGVVGKWHLGLGPARGPDWNTDLTPGPLEVGFDSAYILPATGDRVPTVFVENHRVVGLDPGDPLFVSFDEKVGDDPTGAENPELLRLLPSRGHDGTIVNGVSRIGFMTGANTARWIDEQMSDRFTGKAIAFIEAHRTQRFFLYFAPHDIHVPRLPSARFAGQSGMGTRGDAILELDAAVGEIRRALDRLDLARNTLVVFTSDNGPVLDDGYQDQAAQLSAGHDPSGGFRGGKSSVFEAGTRVPFIVRWPGRVRAGTSAALISQVDFPESFAALAGVTLAAADTPDSHNVLPALLGESAQGRDELVEEGGALALIRGSWKLIAPHRGPPLNPNSGVETGNSLVPQLYDLNTDPGERHDVAAAHPDVVAELTAELTRIQQSGGS